ncbi:MAG: HEAT repeat domain-containing protein, partial [Planctomycetota bacterium]
IQLFVVPALIVAAIVLLWVAINWLANSGSEDPEQIVRSLRRSNQARFQAAKELADMLRMPGRYPELKSSRELALGLAEMLDEMVDQGSEVESDVTMRWIVAGALGEFAVDDGLDSLLKTAQKDPQRDVRRKAVNAIAVLGQTYANREPPQPLAHVDLADVLSQLANQPDDRLLRSEAAFALGVLAQPPGADSRYVDELALLAEDPFPDARYNAANGLARIGDLRALETIVEMLDLEAIEASVEGERKFSDQVSDASLARQRGDKRNLILKNAMGAVGSLLERRSPAELAVLQEPLLRFVAQAPQVDQPRPIPDTYVAAAQDLLDKLAPN